MKILVVEDSPTMRIFARKALNKIGFNEIFEAGDGNSALIILKTENIGLVLTDWNMPKMNGMELIREIRNDNVLKNTPVIVTTTRGQKNDIIEAAKAKINGYLVKPYTAFMLKQKIDKLFDSYRYLEINLKLKIKVGQIFTEPKFEYILKTNESVADNGVIAIKLDHENQSEPIEIHGIKPNISTLGLKITMNDKDGNPIQ